MRPDAAPPPGSVVSALSGANNCQTQETHLENWILETQIAAYLPCTPNISLCGPEDRDNAPLVIPTRKIKYDHYFIKSREHRRLYITWGLRDLKFKCIIAEIECIINGTDFMNSTPLYVNISSERNFKFPCNTRQSGAACHVFITMSFNIIHIHSPQRRISYFTQLPLRQVKLNACNFHSVYGLASDALSFLQWFLKPCHLYSLFIPFRVQENYLFL